MTLIIIIMNGKDSNAVSRVKKKGFITQDRA